MMLSFSSPLLQGIPSKHLKKGADEGESATEGGSAANKELMESVQDKVSLIAAGVNVWCCTFLIKGHVPPFTGCTSY